MNLFVTLYKITEDNNTYVVMDASENEQSETSHRVLASAALDWMYLGTVPVHVFKSYGRSVPPIPLFANIEAAAAAA